jgi:hypothetical protein
MQKAQLKSIADQLEYVTLKTAEQEIGVTRVTLRKYLDQLGVKPKSFHIGDRSLYISRETVNRLKKLKRNPALLEQLQSSQT